ncbi:hypothetical protein [Pseudoalteromonas shioyasakiensis]|uniref:hypothetical protein n=1 Tax=Pseudoalteromonas shioyasakiensis TaxID=1190813 RepID=UPI0022B1881F|nr:hypothetical protein [Pseudoalteromonas shioyasakiensis]MCZ4251792.1 hypothetical protein [Pseudoalteromonas shioyasakiensis]
MEKFVLAILVIPLLIGFVIFSVNSVSEFSKSLENCSHPLLVGCFPFLFLTNNFFNSIGISHKKEAFKNLGLALLCWLSAAVILYVAHQFQYV